MGDSPESRPKRQKRESSYKAKAFEKFKQLKSGNRNKYEVEEMENVYETVDEKQYVKQVLSRQDDDWIVDDDGSGYVEDGRDIFDDDLDTESITAAAKVGKGTKRKKKAISEGAAKGNLQYMISNMPAKKKEEVKLDDDEMLSELLEEIDEGPSTSNTIKPKPISKTQSMLSQKLAAKQYMKSFAAPLPKTPPTKPANFTASSSVSRHKVNSAPVTILKEVQNNNAKQAVLNGESAITENKRQTTSSVTSSKIIPQETTLHENSYKPLLHKTMLHETTTDDTVKDSQSCETVSQNSQTIQEDYSEEFTKDFFDGDIDMAQIEEFESQDLTKTADNVVDAGMTEEIQAEFLKTEDNFADNVDAGMMEDIQAEFLNEWENMQEGVENTTVNHVSVDTRNIPLTEVGSEKVFRFFWWDAFEDAFKQPGVVFLFGKTYSEASKSYVSCCVAVRDIQRRVFVLPRPHMNDDSGCPTDQPVTYQDLYMEFNSQVMKRLRVSNFRTRYIAKKYAFSPQVPKESDYMEVRYSAKDPEIDGSQDGKTFSKIFGTKTSYLEILLLERKIKGPCWLDITAPVAATNPVTWCKYEVNCLKATDLCFSQTTNPIPPPPLVVATINMRCAINPKTFNNEIIMLSCLTQTRYAVDKQAPKPPFSQHFCVFTKPEGQMLPLNIHEVLNTYKGTRVQKMDSEKGLLNYFITQFAAIDADLIVGHDLRGYQINILCERLIKHSITNFSKMSRLKRMGLLKKQKLEKELFAGRLVCDIKISAKELIKSRSYDLDTLCQSVLKIKEGQRADLDSFEVAKMFQTSDDIIKLISYTMQDTAFILQMMYDLHVIPLALQITNIAGNVMSKTLMGGRSERNEFLLLHAFTERDYIAPDKQYASDAARNSASTASRKKPTYSGGLVLEPKVGFYDKLILLMDFNSLYPSIIQEYNICFTTMPLELSENNIVLPDKDTPPGVLPTEIRKLVESRREVKKLMNTSDISSDLRMQYHIRQMALKLTANSMYGCLGFSNSRFYAKNLAALVTSKGREILTNTRDLVQRMCYEVVYGDTDSIMINTNSVDYDQVFKIGSKIKQEVNKLYRQVELDIDGVFKQLLLLKKKKYAAVTMTKTKSGAIKTEMEYKGLDIVRRDWSQLASEAGKMVLKHVMSDQPPDDRINNIHAQLAKLREDIEQERVPMPLLVITKQLTKDPTLYTNKNQLPHVQVALRYNQGLGGHFRAGDTVPYVICDDGTNNPATQRAYHLDELKASKTLKIDIKYYLTQQIHPVVSRILEPIEGTDAIQIGNHLGIDTSSFKKPLDKKEAFTENITKPEVKFRNVDNFVFVCLACKYENTVDGPLKGNIPFLDKCENADCTVRPVEYLHYIRNQLTTAVRYYVDRYYKNGQLCEDPACTNETKKLSLWFAGKYPVCTSCKMGVMYKKYSEFNLYSQLSYFHHIFDVTRLSKKPIMEVQVEKGYHLLKETVIKFLNFSGYAVIDLTKLFSIMGRDNDKKKIVVDKNEKRLIFIDEANISPLEDSDDHDELEI